MLEDTTVSSPDLRFGNKTHDIAYEGVSISITQETKDVLQQVTANFEENLRRGFANAGVRAQRSTKHDKTRNSLDDVFFTIQDNTIIELQNLGISNVLDFRITDLNADLERLNLDISLNIGEIRIDGDYEANNATLQGVLPVNNVGKLSVTLNNVKAAGRIGLYVVEDSFVPKNYDLEYQIGEVSIKVTYYGMDGTELVNEILEDNYEKTLVTTFWRQLRERVGRLLHLRLADVVVEVSVTELLGGEQEHIQDMREHSKQQALKANRLLDGFLCTAKTYLVKEDRSSVFSPPFTAVFWSKPPNQMRRGELAASEGYLQDLTTITRIKDMSLYEDDFRVVVYGHISMGTFKYGYLMYEAKFLDSLVSGYIKTDIYRNEIYLKLSIAKDPEYNMDHNRIERIELVNIHEVNIDVSGLGSLSWLNSSKIASWVIGNLRYKALPILEQELAIAIDLAIKNNSHKLFDT